MNGWILFAVAMASLAAVLAGLAWVAWVAWRLVKRGMRVARDASTALAPTMRGADQATAKVAQLGANAQTLSANVARLQVAFARLGVLGAAFSDGLAPLRKLKEYVGL